ncbi:super-infection exclusion protein B [Morganella morganii]|uniref:super-infection exclusion protein B n=1 Tax=Morganella morganii TaxID=582 RepID=UPI00107A50A5|nr:hypothetical protein [Salmonella enterica subsp. enterica serovar Haifa]
MPSWIEAVLAFLKKQISLRFAMFWFLSWMVLLLFTPSGWSEFIDSGLAARGVPYIGANAFLAAAAYFIGSFVKWLHPHLRDYVNYIKGERHFSNAKKEIQSLPDEEKEIILEMIDHENNSGHVFNEEDNIYLLSLLDKGIVRVVFDPYVTKYDMDGYYKQAAISLMVETYEKERKKQSR